MRKNEKDYLFGSVFCLREDLNEDAYILQIGVCPIDYTKYVKYIETRRTHTQYLYVYLLTAAFFQQLTN